MRIGPKGQVVIPKIFRKAIGLNPGVFVVFELKDDELVLKKPEVKTEEIFAKIAIGRTIKTVNSHEDYEKEMESRWRKMK